MSDYNNDGDLITIVDDDAELDDVYNKFMVLLFDDEDEEEEEKEEK